MEYLEFMSCPIRVFKSRSCLFPTIPVRPEKGYNWTDTCCCHQRNCWSHF
uniref:Uncharacterized protein n=1 Tax=Sinocyclocheilus anshuiensis TaxID=1608454 RepID=A0A671RRF2_9TELE